ncbi:MAG: ATP-dependent DNA ligase [Thermoanaerobaculia bacterium]
MSSTGEAPTPYSLVAETLEQVAGERGKLAKIGLLAGCLQRVVREDLPVAARLLSGAPFAEWEQAVTSVGWSTVAKAASEVTGWDLETLGASARAIGDLGEAISLLLPAASGGQLTVRAVDERLRELSRLRKAAEKQRALEEILRLASPVEGKYLLKTLSGGLRIGADVTTVEEAVARAFGLDREAVGRAHRDSGDIGETALRAREGRLDHIQFRLFHPIGFMLASPVEQAEEIAGELELLAVEDKFDGIRAHAHKAGSHVALFSRTLDDVTAQFPEVALGLALLPGSFLLDGEILAYRDGRPDSFFRLQRRLGRKAPTADLLAEFPVTFIAYDCLARDGQPLFEEPWTARRAALEEIAAGGKLLLSNVERARTPDELERLFSEARARGNEGLMMKRLDSPYQAGKRGRAWRKFKKAVATLDVVVTAVEQGNGKRAGMLSDYTFGVRDGERIVNIGKAYSGLTDEEIRRMGTHFRKITVGRYGPVRAVAPDVVLEVAFDTIQKSTRHRSGYALRFPRIVRIREDKTAAQATTLQEVEGLYASLHR